MDHREKYQSKVSSALLTDVQSFLIKNEHNITNFCSELINVNKDLVICINHLENDVEWGISYAKNLMDITRRLTQETPTLLIKVKEFIIDSKK